MSGRPHDRVVLDRGLGVRVCVELASPEGERAHVDLVLGRALAASVGHRHPREMSLAPPAGRPVAARETAPTPETTVFIPPRTARAPAEAPAPATLPPMLAPVPTADPTVRTTASVGFLTTDGAFSARREPHIRPRHRSAPRPASPPSAHRPRVAPVRPPSRQRGHLITRSPLRHHTDRAKLRADRFRNLRLWP